MWVIRWFLTIVLLIFAVLFAAMNMERVTLQIPFLGRPLDLELAIITLVAVGLGIVVWTVVSFFGSLELRRKIRVLERRNRELQDELTRLRNLSVLDDHELFAEDADPRKESGSLPAVSEGSGKGHEGPQP